MPLFCLSLPKAAKDVLTWLLRSCTTLSRVWTVISVAWNTWNIIFFLWVSGWHLFSNANRMNSKGYNSHHVTRCMWVLRWSWAISQRRNWEKDEVLLLVVLCILFGRKDLFGEMQRDNRNNRTDMNWQFLCNWHIFAAVLGSGPAFTINFEHVCWHT